MEAPRHSVQDRRPSLTGKRMHTVQTPLARSLPARMRRCWHARSLAGWLTSLSYAHWLQ